MRFSLLCVKWWYDAQSVNSLSSISCVTAQMTEWRKEKMPTCCSMRKPNAINAVPPFIAKAFDESSFPHQCCDKDLFRVSTTAETPQDVVNGPVVCRQTKGMTVLPRIICSDQWCDGTNKMNAMRFNFVQRQCVRDGWATKERELWFSVGCLLGCWFNRFAAKTTHPPIIYRPFGWFEFPFFFLPSCSWTRLMKKEEMWTNIAHILQH